MSWKTKQYGKHAGTVCRFGEPGVGEHQGKPWGDCLKEWTQKIRFHYLADIEGSWRKDSSLRVACEVLYASSVRCRFEIFVDRNEALLFIRSEQGHQGGHQGAWHTRSLFMVDPRNYKYVYHATDKKFIPSILKTGLSPGGHLSNQSGSGRGELHCSLLDPVTEFDCYGVAIQLYNFKKNVDASLYSRVHSQMLDFNLDAHGGPLFLAILLGHFTTTDDAAKTHITTLVTNCNIKTMAIGERILDIVDLLRALSDTLYLLKNNSLPDKYIDKMINITDTTSVPMFNDLFVALKQVVTATCLQANIPDLICGVLCGVVFNPGPGT